MGRSRQVLVRSKLELVRSKRLELELARSKQLELVQVRSKRVLELRSKLGQLRSSCSF
ncbi:hypothetical protein [Rhodopirellula sp. P2]|uniref:hypothetical protein n=1 Tax=Rhodopirellula sp. P2 TaxID=2127060 RepID=UPI0023677195|nr:hypothetical protein [Rhodopirellula sp. P2]WDQ14755.1 hypothetical protein PSR62_14010 [Rhodopirellula sp. P2]